MMFFHCIQIYTYMFVHVKIYFTCQRKERDFKTLSVFFHSQLPRLFCIGVDQRRTASEPREPDRNLATSVMFTLQN